MISMSKVKDIRGMGRRGHTVAEISRHTGVSEPTVRKYLRQEDFSPKKPVRRELPSILDPHKPRIDAWLTGDRRNRRKQRHTSKRVFERLRDEEGYEGSYNTVNRYVQRWRGEHRAPRDEYLDLDWPPGEMQVDFGRADFRIAGVRRRMRHLVGSSPFSNVGLPQIFPGENAECVCSGLIAIFDNAAGVGRKVCGEIRTSELFSAFAAHYGFDYSFCNADAGHEKGDVENKVGALRRSLFVPIPMFGNVANCNRRIPGAGLEHSGKEHYRKGESELALFEEDCFALMPLPPTGFEAVTCRTCRADRYGNVVLDGRHRYSSDPSLAGRELVVGAGAFEVSVFDPKGTLVAAHDRGYGSRPTESVHPAGQLALLARKPGGWPNGRVRSSMPDALRGWMDAAEPAGRGRVLGMLRDVTEESGYSNALAALERMVEAGPGMDAATAGVLASGMANGRGVVTYGEPADMPPHDAVFSAAGGGADAWQGGQGEAVRLGGVLRAHAQAVEPDGRVVPRAGDARPAAGRRRAVRPRDRDARGQQEGPPHAAGEVPRRQVGRPVRPPRPHVPGGLRLG